MADERTLTANFTADSSGFAAGTDETIRKLRELNAQVIENKQKIRDTNAEMRKYQQELDKLKSSTKNGATATADERKRMQELTDSIAKCKVNLGVFATAQQRLKSDVHAVNKELDGQREAARSVSEALLSMGDIIKANLSSEAIMGAINVLNGGLRQAAVYCYGVGMEFEAAMSQVEAVSGAYGESLDALTKKAKELGSSTKFTATQVAEAMNYMAMAGWNAEQMLAGIDGVIGLAAASGADLATVSDIVTDALTAFGMKAEDVGHFSDVLAAASANANTNVTMLGESFKYVAPLAGTMGYSIEDVAEALGIMANSGIKASTAGTALRSVLTNLANGVEIEAAAFGKMNISAANADGSMKELGETFGELRNAFSQMTEEEQTSNAKLIAGQEALSGFLALVNAGEADINKLRSAIENCNGAAANMANTMQDNVAGKATVLKSALEGLGIAIYDRFAGPLGETLDNITGKIEKLGDSAENGELADSFDDLAESAGDAAEELVDFLGEVLPDFIGGVSGVLNFLVNCRTEIAAVVQAIIALKGAMAIGKVVGSAISSISGLVKAIKAATTAQETFGAVMTKTPWGLVAAGVGLLVGVIMNIALHANNAAEKVKQLTEEIDHAADSAEEYRDKSEALKDVKKRYEEIENSALSASEKSEQLKSLQEQLISQFPELKNKIDLVTGSYDNMAEAIQRGIELSDKMSLISATAAYNKMVEREETEKKIVDENYSHQNNVDGALAYFLPDEYADIALALQDDRVKNILRELSKEYENLNFEDVNTPGINSDYKISIGGNSKEKYKVYSAILDELTEQGIATDGAIAKYFNVLEEQAKHYQEQAQDAERVRKQYEPYTRPDALKLVDYNSEKGDLAAALEKQEISYEEYYERLRELRDNYLEQNGENWSDITNQITDSYAQSLENYNSEKEALAASLAAKEISHKDYYERLRALRDKYFDEGSDNWVKANDEIGEFLEKNNAQIVKDICNSADKAADGTVSAADKIAKAVDKTGDKIKGVFSDIKSEFQELLDGIDRELEKHNRDKEDEEYRSKIESLTNRLRYEKLDIYTRRNLEKELDDLGEGWEEVQFKRKNADKKSIVQEAANQAGVIASNASDITKLTQTQWNNIISAFRGASPYIKASDFTNKTAQNVYNIVINGSNKTEKQIEDEIMRKISSEVV